MLSYSTQKLFRWRLFATPDYLAPDWTKKHQEKPETVQPENLNERSSQSEIDTKHQMNREMFLSLLRKSRKLKALLKMATGVEEEIEGYIRLH